MYNFSLFLTDPIITEIPRSVNVSYGDSLTLDGFLIESAVETIDANSTFWMRDGNIIKVNTIAPEVINSRFTYILESQAMIIPRVNFVHEGIYQCGVRISGVMQRPFVSEEFQVQVKGN